MREAILVRLGIPHVRGSGAFLAALLSDALGSGLFLPFSLLFFHVAVGLPLAEVGVALTTATALTLPITPLVGTLVDRIGARQITIASRLFQATGFLAYFALVRSIPALFCAALLVTAGSRMFYAAHPVLIAEIATADERDRWYGLVSAFRYVGYGLGGVLAGLLITAGGVASYRLLVAADVLSSLVAAVLLLRLQVPSHDGAAHPRTTGYRVVLRDKAFIGLATGNVAFALCSVTLQIGLPVYLTATLGVPIWVVGTLFAVDTALLATMQTVIVRLIESHRRTRALIAAGLAWGGACGLYALAGSVPGFVLIPYLFVTTVMFTLGGLLHGPTASALAATSGPPALRGRYLATYQLSWGIATALAPAFFTNLFTAGPALPWLTLSGLTLAASLVVYLIEPQLPAEAVRIGTHSR